MQKPLYFDELFSIGVVLLFLMINYDMPLSNIYQNMSYWVLFGYLVPLIFSLFSWLPLTRGNGVKSIIIGIVLGIAFIQLYNYLKSTMPMASVFAATAYGDSVLLGKLLFSGPIPIIESVFFFVILPGWVIWKMGQAITNHISGFNMIFLIILCAGLFTAFHATSKGIENNEALIATFIFGAISTGAMLFFKSALEMIIMHITVNSYAVGLFDTMKGMALSTPVIIAVAVVGYLLVAKKSPFTT